MRLGVIGAGAIAARHLAVIPEADSGVEIVAHLSRRLERAAAAADRFGGAAFADLDAFLAEGRPDAVLITVPPAEHGMVERALIRARIPFLVEKPIGIDIETPDEIAGSIAADLVVAAGYNWRALDTLDEVRRLLAETPARMVLGRFHGGTPAASWWRFEAMSGGQMLEQACHLVDLARHLLGDGKLIGATGSYGALPQFSDGDIAGTSAALLNFSGVPGVITATALLPGGPGPELRLICLGREIVITLAGIDIVEGGQTRRIESRSSSYLRQDRRFFAAVRSGRVDDVYCGYADALSTHRLCLAIQGAIQLNR
jgi:myo-inositol 2-dehydrogenase/D-chiro-inositol 1-dehydrogenase